MRYGGHIPQVGDADRDSRLFLALSLLGLSGVLLPFEPASPLSNPRMTGPLADYLLALPNQFYVMIKSVMLWVPLGLLATFAGQARNLYALMPWAVVLMAALGLPLLPHARFADLLEIMFVLPGVALGIWLGQRAALAALAGTATDTLAGDPRSLSQPPAPTTVPPAESGGSQVTHRGNGRRRHDGRRRSEAAIWVWPTGILAIASLGAALFGWLDFPRWQAALGAGLILYAFVLWFRPAACLVVVPAALPVLDLAPWTGRFFLDEFDLVMLVTVGMALLRRPREKPEAPPPGTLILIALFALVLMASGLIGLLPLPPWDANALSSYWSPFNSLRIAKGFAWGGVLFLLVRRFFVDGPGSTRLLTIGMGLGLLGACGIGLWEHWLYAGLAAGGTDYRIVSTFSSMHTGGGHIEAYLVAALPFLWLATSRWRDMLIAGPLMMLVAVALVYTVSRGGALALGVVLVVLTVASFQRIHARGAARLAASLGILAALAGVLAAGLSGGYFQQRLSQTGEDWRTRVGHWSQALALMEGDVVTRSLGMGLGSFPRVYLEKGPAEAQPATYGFAVDGGNTYLRLGSGETLYYAQRVAVQPGATYLLQFDARARREGGRLEVPLCEKQMLDSRRCVWSAFNLADPNGWRRYSLDVSSGELGAGGPLSHPPVELFFHQPGKGAVVEVDNVRLLDPSGHNLLCNGDFARGGDCWFFKTHSHLPWHIKNLWVHVQFEQGWLGTVLFALLATLALARLTRAAWGGDALAWVLLASLGGLLTVGVFDSLLDAPRLATLLVAWLLLGSSMPVTGRRRAANPA